MYTLGANNSSPGVRNFYFTSESVTPMTDNGVITSFNESVSDFLKFENANTSGSWAVNVDFGPGGQRFNINVSGAIYGLSQGRIEYLKDLINSYRFSLLAEMNDRSVYFFSGTTFTTSNANITSNNGITFNIIAQTASQPSQVSVDLAGMITGDVTREPLVLMDKDGDPITDKNNENITI